MQADVVVQETRLRRIVSTVTCGGNAIPAQLWVLYVILFFESFAWYSDSMSFVTLMSEEFKMTDVEAGWAYGEWGLSLSILAFISGPLIDRIGFKMSIVFGAALSIIARLAIAFSTNVSVTLWITYTVYAFGTNFIGSSISIGTKRYMRGGETSSSFSIQYTISNLGAFVGFNSVDWFRSGQFNAFFSNSMAISGLKAMRGFNAFLSLICVVLALITFLCFKSTIYEQDFAERIEKEQETEWLTADKSWWREMYNSVTTIVYEANFLRLVFFSLILVGVRSIFKHLDTTFPKYVVRAIDPAGQFGLLLSINPLIVIIFAPIFTTIFSSPKDEETTAAATTSVSNCWTWVRRKCSLYTLIIAGTTISALSVWFLAFESSYTTVILFMVVFSIGEAFHGPRANEYSLQMSRDGKEGIYATLCSFPFFFVKLFSGGMWKSVV